MPTAEYALCIDIFVYLFIGLSRSTVQTTIVYGVNLFTMPGIQPVVYAKSSKVLTATSCCLLLIAMNQGRIQDFLKGGSENLKKGVWSAAPKAIGICVVKHQIIHFEHIFKQLSLVSVCS